MELFATKKVDSTLHFDLNRNASPLNGSHQPMKQEEMSPPRWNQHDNNEYGDDEDEVEFHDNNVKILDKYHTQEIMDHDLPYSRRQQGSKTFS
jgi:hypothetical protein